MTFLYPWLFFILIPTYFLYKSEKSLDDSTRKKQRKLLYLSFGLIVIALTRPVIINTPQEQKFDANDYIVAIDASYSMQANDLKPTRYEVAKQNIQELLKELPKDRFSIFAFTSNTMLISPPTTDTEISMMALDVLNPEFIMTKGTSLSELLKTVSKISYEKKYLIIFSDGGEESDLKQLVSLAKKNNIVAYVAATASKDGAILKKNGNNIRDENNNLVITRVNHILKVFALKSGGNYYEMDSSKNSVVSDIVSDLRTDSKNKETINMNVISYKELFWIPLLISIIIFFTAVTKIHQLYLLLFPLIIVSEKSYANALDFYHLKKANVNYEKKEYLNSAKEFEKITPSVESFYNLGVAYYKSAHYKKAFKTFSKIKSKDSSIKQKLFYNMGNCAVKLKKYERAKLYYRQALALGYDKQSYENLMLLYRLNLKEKKDVSNMMPKKSSNESTKASKKNNVEKDESKSGSSSSNQKSGDSSNASSGGSKKSSNKKTEKSDKINTSQYKIGYKAYELINSGYINEKHPW